MSRDSNGNYTLPIGNPVVSGTTIDTKWANPTMSDIATEMTNSLSRTGKGGMLAPFKLPDGGTSDPALSFNSDPNSGLYREANGDVRMVVNSFPVMRWFGSGSYFWDTAKAEWTNIFAITSQNTSNIATNTANIATNTTNIADLQDLAETGQGALNPDFSSGGNLTNIISRVGNVVTFTFNGTAGGLTLPAGTTIITIPAEFLPSVVTNPTYIQGGAYAEYLATGTPEPVLLRFRIDLDTGAVYLPNASTTASLAVGLTATWLI